MLGPNCYWQFHERAVEEILIEAETRRVEGRLFMDGYFIGCTQSAGRVAAKGRWNYFKMVKTEEGEVQICCLHMNVLKFFQSIIRLIKVELLLTNFSFFFCFASYRLAVVVAAEGLYYRLIQSPN